MNADEIEDRSNERAREACSDDTADQDYIYYDKYGNAVYVSV